MYEHNSQSVWKYIYVVNRAASLIKIKVSFFLLAMTSQEERKEALLKKVYFEGCPGCKMEQKKQAATRKPYLEFFYIWLITLCTSLPISSLFPFVYFMVRDLHIAKMEEDIGFYAGFVGSSFMVGRALTSIFWGMMADRYGRKPVIVIGTVSVIIFNTLFGLSVNYWMAIITRFLLGSLNGIIGPILAYSVEVCREEYQAVGLSLISTAWGIGLIVGPAIGGYLAQPAEKHPHLFSKDSIFGRFPYFLPCLCISLFAVGAFIACFWLPETLHMHNERELTEGIVEDLETPCSSAGKEKDKEKQKGHSAESLMKNWPLVSSIIVYCVFSLHDMAYTEIFSIWSESEKKYGGLSFSSEDVGQAFAISGCSLLVFQLFFYPPLTKIFGPIMSARVASALSIPLLASYPFMTKLSGSGLVLIVNCASSLKNVLSVIIVTGTVMLQNNAVPQHERGAANGISTTAVSVFKAVAPASAGALFSWAQRRQHATFLPGDQMVFFVMNVVEVVGLLLTFKPFLTLPSK